MFNLKRIRSFTILFVLLVSALAQAGGTDGGGKALIIIDMQPYFAERGGNHEKEENAKKLKEVLANQVKSIAAAKEAGIPIVFLEYENYGPTSKTLKDAIGDYDKSKYFLKNTDGMFSSWNNHVDKLDDYLESQKVKTLIITGANGGACVESSISGALKENYNVIAFSKGIADFNYRDFIYPYDDEYDFANPKCKDCSFKEVDELHEVVLAVHSKKEKGDHSKRVNDASRGSGAKRLPHSSQEDSSESSESLSK